jgi:hypothetical protein
MRYSDNLQAPYYFVIKRNMQSARRLPSYQPELDTFARHLAGQALETTRLLTLWPARVGKAEGFQGDPFLQGFFLGRAERGNEAR